MAAYPRARPFALGDDATDESMFQSVNELGGTSVRVGTGGKSHARFRVKNLDRVARLIREWAGNGV